MKAEIRAVLDRVKNTAEFGYVEFDDINATNELGDNALHCVIVWGDFEAAKLLIDNGINIEQPGEGLNTPLHAACAFGCEPIARLLLERGANPYARTEGSLPFTLARLGGHGSICDLLQSKLVPAEPIASTEKAALHLAHLQQQNRTLEEQLASVCGRGPV